MRFLFYDRILEMEIGKRALAKKMVALADEYFPEHYPRRAVMPPTLLLEAIAQVAGWLNVASSNFAIETILGLIEGVQIYQQVYPGDTLTIEVWMLFSHRDGATLKGEVRIEGDIVATADRMVFGNKYITDRHSISEKKERFQYLSGKIHIAGEL